MHWDINTEKKTFYEFGASALHLMLQPEFDALVLPSMEMNRFTTLL